MKCVLYQQKNLTRHLDPLPGADTGPFFNFHTKTLYFHWLSVAIKSVRRYQYRLKDDIFALYAILSPRINKTSAVVISRFKLNATHTSFKNFSEASEMLFSTKFSLVFGVFWGVPSSFHSNYVLSSLIKCQYVTKKS